jgi:hypothetical protein
MKAKDDLQREIQAQSRKSALRFIAALVMSAACCAGFVSWVIWLTNQ